MDIEIRVKKIIADKIKKPIDEIVSSARFVEDFGTDSLTVVEIVMAMEEEFNISIPDEDAEKIKTVGDAVNYIKSKTGKS